MADNTLNSSAQGSWLERRFALYSRGSTLRTAGSADVDEQAMSGAMADEQSRDAKRRGRTAALYYYRPP